jgi:hypothetical protein
MGLLDRVKAGAEQAASQAQRQAQIVQTKRELSQAYSDLGKTTYGLVERGELSHGDLAAGVDKIKELQARLDGHGDDGAADSPATDAGAGASSGDADIVE